MPARCVCVHPLYTPLVRLAAIVTRTATSPETRNGPQEPNHQKLHPSVLHAFHQHHNSITDLLPLGGVAMPHCARVPPHSIPHQVHHPAVGLQLWPIIMAGGVAWYCCQTVAARPSSPPILPPSGASRGRTAAARGAATPCSAPSASTLQSKCARRAPLHRTGTHPGPCTACSLHKARTPTCRRSQLHKHACVHAGRALSPAHRTRAGAAAHRARPAPTCTACQQRMMRPTTAKTWGLTSLGERRWVACGLPPLGGGGRVGRRGEGRRGEEGGVRKQRLV